jgi:hypothetical protein
MRKLLLALGVVQFRLTSGHAGHKAQHRLPSYRHRQRPLPRKRRTHRVAACSNTRLKPTPSRIAAPIRSSGATRVHTCCMMPAPNTTGRPHMVPTCAKGLPLLRAITKPRNKKPSQFNAGKRRRGVERHSTTFCLCRLPSTLQPVQPSPYTVRP